MPEVTVLLPVYNGERYLQESIQSILSQSYKDFELLIVDDGSTDNSPEIIRSFSDQRIRILKNSERLKLSGALNRGLDEARGKYIARMDADDIAMPERLNKQVDFMERNPETGVCGTAIMIFGDNVKQRVDTYPEKTDKIKTYALFDCPFCHPAVMFRRDLFDAHKLRFNGDFYPTEDYELWSRATMLFPSANLQDVLLRYRIHGDSMTGSDWDRMDRKAAEIIRVLLENLGMQFTEEELRLHRNIGRGRSCRVDGIEDLRTAESWLLKLLEANRKQGKYDASALFETVSLVWYRLCLNNTRLGLKVIGTFTSSSLLKNDTIKSTRIPMLLLSVIRNRLLQTKTGETHA